MVDATRWQRAEEDDVEYGFELEHAELGDAIIKGDGIISASDLRHLAGASVQPGHYVVAGDAVWVPHRVANEGTLSGLPQGPLGERIAFTVGHKSRAKAKRQAADREEARKRQRELEGLEADAQGWWQITEILDVQRPTPRRGRRLSALVRWAGHDVDTGRPWSDSCHPVTQGCMSQDRIDEARAMEATKYGVGGSKRGLGAGATEVYAASPAQGAGTGAWRGDRLRVRDADGRAAVREAAR